MNVRYYLRHPQRANVSIKNRSKSDKKDSTTKRAIYALINYGGISVKYYIGESINPKHWNPSTQSARNSSSFPEHPEFNARLDNIRSTINKIFLTYRTERNSDPSREKLKELIDAELKGTASAHSFLSYFQDYIDRTREGARINPRSQKPIRGHVSKGYQTTLTHLNKFALRWHRKLNFDSVDLEFHADFTRFLSGKPLLLSANTIGSHFQRIKAVMSEATEKGLNKNQAYKSRHFVKQVEEVDAIYMSEKELADWRNLDLRKSARLDNVRDLFLIGAFTGLRYSDFSILNPTHIKGGFIRISQTKTGNPVTIPVHPIVKSILDKRDGQLPNSISNQKTNDALKEIGALVKSLKVKETLTRTTGGAKVTQVFEKWQLITTHTARRSFATNEYLAGTPTIMIMAITGHKTEKAFLKYIRVTPEEHAHKLKDLWEKRSTQLRAV